MDELSPIPSNRIIDSWNAIEAGMLRDLQLNYYGEFGFPYMKKIRKYLQEKRSIGLLGDVELHPRMTSVAREFFVILGVYEMTWNKILLTGLSQYAQIKSISIRRPVSRKTVDVAFIAESKSSNIWE